MEGVGQKRFSGVWKQFAKGLYDWTLGYENVGEMCVGDTDTPKSAFDLEYELEKILSEKPGDLAWFFRSVSTALSRVFIVLPRILMSDKRDMRYEQVVREYCAECLDVFLDAWHTVQKRGGGISGQSMLDAGFIHAPYIPLLTPGAPKSEG